MPLRPKPAPRQQAIDPDAPLTMRDLLGILPAISRAVLDKADTSRTQHHVENATIVGNGDVLNGVRYLNVHIDGDDENETHLIASFLPGTHTIGQRVLVQFTPPHGAFIYASSQTIECVPFSTGNAIEPQISAAWPYAEDTRIISLIVGIREASAFPIEFDIVRINSDASIQTMETVTVPANTQCYVQDLEIDVDECELIYIDITIGEGDGTGFTVLLCGMPWPTDPHINPFPPG